MLILMIGPSGVGKNSVIDLLKSRHKNLEFLPSVTTREKRNAPGSTHIHVTKKKFLEMQKRGEFFECENVHANYLYGTLNSSLEKAKDDKKVFIKDIDVKGAIKVQQFLGREKCKTIFLDAPDEVLKERLKKRGESEDMIAVRMKRYDMERRFKNEFDFCVENIDIVETIRKIEKFVNLKRFD